MIRFLAAMFIFFASFPGVSVQGRAEDVPSADKANATGSSLVEGAASSNSVDAEVEVSAERRANGRKLYQRLTKTWNNQGKNKAFREFESLSKKDQADVRWAARFDHWEYKTREFRPSNFRDRSDCYGFSVTATGKSGAGFVFAEYTQDLLWCGDKRTNTIVEDRSIGAPNCRTTFDTNSYGFGYSLKNESSKCEPWGGGIGTGFINYASQAVFEGPCLQAGPFGGCYTYSTWVWQSGRADGTYRQDWGEGAIPINP